MHYAVILAGGSGKRLWPMSRHTRPKQLLRLFDGQSLLKKAFDRLLTVFEPEHIFVCAGADQCEAMLAELPQLPPGHFICEPVGRDTANAIGLAAHILARHHPQATFGIFTADHLITPADRFADAVRKAYAHVVHNPNVLVTFGIPPTHPHTGLGYIHRGQRLADGIWTVLGFKEKPDHQTARLYIDSGQYLWNCGMFVWKVLAILAELSEHLPDNAKTLAEIAAGWPTERGKKIPEKLADQFARLPKISIDFAVMEKSKHVRCIEMPCTWLDVGSWPALASVLHPDENGNLVAGAKTASLDSEGNLLISESGHLLAVMGMEHVAVVHTPDATLICPLNEAERLKELTDLIEKRYPQQYS